MTSASVRSSVLVGALLWAAASGARDVPPLTGRVVDLAEALSPSAVSVLTDQLAAHEAATGHQVVVLTVPSLEGEALEPYATRVFRTWGLGREGVDDGVLLLVALGDRQLRIEVGYGLEGTLTDATAGTIIRTVIVPSFRDGHYEAGIVAGTEAILAVLGGEAVPFSPMAEERPPWWFFLFMSLFPLGFSLAALTHGPTGRYVIATLLAGAIGGFVAIAGSVLAWPVTDRVEAAVGAALLYLLVFGLVDWAIGRSRSASAWRQHQQRKHEAFRRARRSGARSVVVDGRSYSVPAGSSSGGGFSGGGGSSGGGGASGSW